MSKWFSKQSIQAARDRYLEGISDMKNAELTGCSIFTIESWKNKFWWTRMRQERKERNPEFQKFESRDPDPDPTPNKKTYVSPRDGTIKRPPRTRAGGRTIVVRNPISPTTKPSPDPESPTEPRPKEEPPPGRVWKWDEHLQTWCLEDKTDPTNP